MTCREAEELLGAYFDGELDLTRSVDIEVHVRDCKVCADILKRHEALRSVLAAHAPYYTAPKGLLKTSAPRTWWLPVAASIAVASLVLWGIGPRPFQPASAEVEKQVVAAHVRSLLANHLMDVASTDKHTVKPWFTGKLDFAPDVEDLAARGFPLQGGRLDYVDGRTVAALIYRRGQHTINVFTWPDNRADAGLHLESMQGFNVARWTRGGMSWWAVSDASGAELGELARALGVR